MAVKPPIYLDNHATTPVDPRVLEAMRPFFSEHFGNAASKTHVFGWRAEEAVNVARAQVAVLLRAADPKEIVWTSGTTESINLALIGASDANRSKGDHIVSCVTEHRAALDTLRFLETRGFRVTLLPVDASGRVDPSDVDRAIEDKTILLSFMAANNEIGTLHPIAEIGRIAKEKGVLFHVDAAQACGKIPMDVQTMGIDLLSASAHKAYGPKGIGVLYIRSRHPHVRIEPILHGGGQERGLRPGTLAVPNIVGMGRAFEIAEAERVTESARLLGLRERLKKGLMERVPKAILNGHPTERLAGNLNLSFLGLRSDALIPRVRDVALSSGSACASFETAEPSYVIRALGGPEGRALSSIRFGIGRFNTEEEIDFAIEQIAEAANGL
jgi:cysteine desulfurase